MECQLPMGTSTSVAELAFAKGPGGQKVTRVISAMGKSPNSKESCKFIEFDAHKLLIELAKKYAVDQFILLSSCKVSKPYNYIALFLNLIVYDVMSYKVMVENYLRCSSLNYLIIRSG